MTFEVISHRVNRFQRRCNVPFAEEPPTERSGMRMASDRNYIYVVGGYSPKRVPLLAEEVWRFNVLSDEWELMDIPNEHFPEELASFASCYFGNPDLCEFYMFGGTAVPFGQRASNSVSLLKRLGNGSFIWKRLKTKGSEPVEQYGSCLVFNKGKFYVLGGTTGWVYNLEVRSLEPVYSNEMKSDGGEAEPKRWKWTLLHNGSGVIGRYRHEAIVVDDEIVLVGGGTPEWTSPLTELLVFNISERKFRTQITSPDINYGYPVGRLYHSCVKFDEYIYLFGGCTERTITEHLILPPKLLQDCWELDLREWRWRRLSRQLNQELCFHAATITANGCVYIFGGTTDDRFENRTNELQRCWIRPPSLLLISARAVLNAYPLLSERFHDITLTNIVSYVLTVLSEIS